MERTTTMLQKYRARRAAHKELMAKLDNLTNQTLIGNMWYVHCVVNRIGDARFQMYSTLKSYGMNEREANRRVMEVVRKGYL